MAARSATVRARRRTRSSPRALRAPDRTRLSSSLVAAELIGANRSSSGPGRSALMHPAPFDSPSSGVGHPCRHRRRGLRGERPEELVDVRSVDPDGYVEAIEEWCRQPPGVAVTCRVGAAAGTGKPTFAARARVHRPHQDEPRRKGRRAPGPAHPHHTLFEGLAERIEHRGRELPHLVQEQDSAVGETDLARAHPCGATADHGDGRGAVMRGPERRSLHQPGFGPRQPGNRVHPGDLHGHRPR